jgi:hypothetical protein
VIRRRLPHRPGPWTPYDPREGFKPKPQVVDPVPVPDTHETGWDRWDEAQAEFDDTTFPDTIIGDV